MSHAEPMDTDRRPVATPRQRRRYWKKLNQQQDWGCYPNGEDYVPSYDGMPEAHRPKGHSTPRQRKPRRDG